MWGGGVKRGVYVSYNRDFLPWLHIISPGSPGKLLKQEMLVPHSKVIKSNLEVEPRHF